MQVMTKKAISKLLMDTNHVLAVADFDLIEELDKIAEGLASVSKSEQRLLNTPFVLCGIRFYPLTVAKSLWYAEMCAEWEVEGMQQDGLLFWLLTLPNNELELDTYSDQKKADRACRKLSRRLHCTQDEMTAVYHKCLGLKDVLADNKDHADTDYGGMIAVLLREYGGTPEKWLYETPVEVISSLFKAYADKVTAENDVGRQAASHKGKAIAPTPTKRLKSLKMFRIKANEIKELWSKNGE